MTKPEITTTIKQTISVKQRTEVGDEVFISVGQEYHNVPVAEADAMKATLDESLSAWLETRVSSVAGAAFESYSDPEKGVAETEDDEDEEAEAKAADDEEADDELTIEDVQAMKVGELRELIEAHELDVDPKLKVKELREAVIAALFEEEDEEEADEEEEDDEESEDADDEEEGDEEDEEDEESEEEDEPYTEDELKALKLAELQEIAEAWELKVKHKKGADLKAKKADFVKAILEAQEG